MRARLLLVFVAACHATPPPAPGTPEDLAVYLRTVVGADEATRTREVATWIIDDEMWNSTIVQPWRDLRADYVHGFDAAVPAMVARLAPPVEVTARRHFAGDPRLTRAQGRLRWTVPVQFPSAVAELAGVPLDTVFIYGKGHWRALIGVDELVLARIRALDPACADALGHAGPAGRCTEIGWLVADSALRAQHERFAHACQLASSLCGTGSR